MRTTSSTLLAILLMVFALSTISCKKDIGGCTDPASLSYNPEATMDDGSCQYSGCTDPQSESYNPQATINDGSCQYKGCTDPNSVNFNPQATIDDSSCAYERDPFIGTFNGAEECVLDDGRKETFNWVMTIEAAVSNDVSEVTIWNLGSYGVTLDGVIHGDEISFNYNDGYLVINGSGTMSGSKIEFSYTASAPSLGLSETCEGVATKQ